MVVLHNPRGMSTTLYGIPASHPTFATTLMLERNGIAYRRIDLPQWFHRPLLRVLRPLIAARPASELARRIAPAYPGRIPPAFPGEWLPAG